MIEWGICSIGKAMQVFDAAHREKGVTQWTKVFSDSVHGSQGVPSVVGKERVVVRPLYENGVVVS